MQKTSVGDLLKRFRAQAGLSQLDLACAAEISQRHLSFVETGRTNISRELVMQLGDTLSLSQLELNALLLAAGFAPISHNIENNPEAAGLMLAAEKMLQWQAPNPALILGEDWKVRGANQPAVKLINYFSPGPDLISLNGLDMLELITDARYLQSAIGNFEEIMEFVQTRLEFEAPGKLAPHRILGGTEAVPIALLPLVLVRGNEGEQICVRFETTLVTVGTVQDAHVGEVRIETFFPADAVTEGFVRSLTSEAVA